MFEGDEKSHGIHYLKFFVAFMLLFVHMLVFSSMADPHGVDIRNPGLLHLMAFVPMSLLAPLTAGAVQAIALKNHLVTGRLLDFPLWQFLKIMLVLAFVESLKAAIVYMPSVFFGWNVLHFLALALMVTLALARLSVHLVWLSGVLCLALTPAMQWLLAPFQVDGEDQIRFIYGSGLPQLFKLLILIVSCVVPLLWVWRRLSIARQYKVRLSLIVLLLFNCALFIAVRTPIDLYFAPRILNLPAGLLVGDRLGLHYWPFFPWYAGVAFGFSLYYFLSQSPHRKALRIGVAGTAVVGLLVHFWWLERDVIATIDPSNIWGMELFNNNLKVIVFTLSSFALFALAFERLADSETWQRWCRRWPLLWRVPFVYSKTILWAYLTINFFGHLIAWAFAPVLTNVMNRIVLSLMIAATWYWPGEQLIRWLARTRFTVRFSPANRDAI